MLPNDPNSNNQNPSDQNAPNLGSFSASPTNDLNDQPIIQDNSSLTPHGNNPLPTDPHFPPKPSIVPPDAYSGFQKEKEMMQKQDEYQIEEIGKELDLEKEVKEAGVEKIGEEITLPEMVKKNEFIKEDQIVVSVVPPAPQLPLTNNQAKKALHKKVSEAVVWLAVWCLRQIKIYQNKEKA